MSGTDFTTTGFLTSLKLRGMLPSTSETFSSTDFLSIATEELRTYVMAALLSVNEEYGVADADTTTTAGTASYATPTRAVGDALRGVFYADSSGAYVPLTRLDPRDDGGSANTGSVTGFYFQDNSIVLVPTPAAAGTLRLKYARRPGALVATTAVAVISSIDSGRTVITTTGTIPSTFTTGLYVDVIDQAPGFRTLAMDLLTTATTSGTTITTTTALPSTVAAGDYVCLAGDSPVPQIPVEAHPLLAQRTKAAVLGALGDAKVGAAEASCDRMRKDLVGLLTPRAEANPKVIVNRHGPGFGGRYRG